MLLDVPSAAQPSVSSVPPFAVLAVFDLDNFYVDIIYLPGKSASGDFLHTPKKDLGYPRPYLRDGVPGLPFDRQIEMLREAGVDVSDRSKLYVDRLTKAAVKRRDPASLKDRGDVLNPWREGETIFVASLRVLGWTMSDIARSLLAAAEHKANVHCVDTGQTFSDDMPAEALLEALASADEAHRRAVVKERQARATTASERARAKRKEARLALIRGRWHDRAYDTDELIKESGLSRRTVYTALKARFPDERIEHA